MTDRSAAERIPLKQPVLHILLALAKADLHGLGIADEVEATSRGTVRLGPGTLYRSLDEMRDSGTVARATPAEGSDPRRKYYRITPDGRELLQVEMERLQRLVEQAKSDSILPAGT